MIKSKELKCLVEETIRFFKEGSEFDGCYYEDVAWDYARGVLEDTLDKNKKQDLYSRLILDLLKNLIMIIMITKSIK